MPPDPKLAHLTQIDHRRHWKELKAKHDKAIKAAKLDFDQKLGPNLDKYETQIETLKRLAAKGEVTNAQIQPVKLVAAPLATIAESYLGKVKVLPDPAKTELTGLLTAIEADCKGWEHLVLAPSAAATEAQKEAAGDLALRLERIASYWNNMLLSRLPGALAFYTKEKAKYANGPTVASNLMQKGRAAGPLANTLHTLGAQASDGTNYPLFKSRCKAAIPALKAYHDAAQEFQTASNKIAEKGGIKTGHVDSRAVAEYCKNVIENTNLAIIEINKLP